MTFTIEILKDGTINMPPVFNVLYPNIVVSPGSDLRSVKISLGTPLLGGSTETTVSCISNGHMRTVNRTVSDPTNRHVTYDPANSYLYIDLTAGASMTWIRENCQALFPFVERLYIKNSMGWADRTSPHFDIFSAGVTLFPNLKTMCIRNEASGQSLIMYDYEDCIGYPFNMPPEIQIPTSGKLLYNTSYTVIPIQYFTNYDVQAVKSDLYAATPLLPAGVGLYTDWYTNAVVNIGFNVATLRGTWEPGSMQNYRHGVAIQRYDIGALWVDENVDPFIAAMSSNGTLFTFNGFLTILDYKAGGKTIYYGLAQYIHAHSMTTYYAMYSTNTYWNAFYSEVNSILSLQHIYIGHNQEKGYFHTDAQGTKLHIETQYTSTLHPLTRHIDEVEFFFTSDNSDAYIINQMFCGNNIHNFCNSFTLFDQNGSIGFYYNAIEGSVGSSRASIINIIPSITCVAAITTLHIFADTNIEGITGSASITDIWIDDIENQLVVGFAAIIQFPNLATINGVPVTTCLFYDLIKGGVLTWTPTLKNQMYTWPDLYHTLVTRPNARTIDGVTYELPRTILDCTPVFNPSISAGQLVCIENLHTIATRFAAIETVLPEQLKMILGMAIEALACSNAIGFYVWWLNGTGYTADYKDYAHGRISNFGLSQPGSLIDIPKIAFVSDGWSTISWIKNDPFDAYSVPLNDIFPKKIAYTIKTAPGEGIQPYEITYTQKNHDGTTAPDQNMNLYTPYGVVPRDQHV